MNNKKKLYIIIGLVSLIVVFAGVSIYISSLVKIAGSYKVQIETKSGNDDNFTLTANGVFGSENQIVSRNGYIYLEGYYKSLTFGIQNEGIENLEKVILIDNTNGEKIVVQSQNCILEDNILLIDESALQENNSGAIKNLFYIIRFETHKDSFRDLLLILGVVLLLVFAFHAVKRLRKVSKQQAGSAFRAFFVNASVFVAGTVFWMVVVLLLLEVSLRIVGYIYTEKQNSPEIQNNDEKFVVLCIGDSFTYGVGSTKGNTYPEQLQHILEEQTDKEVIVVNRGRCAQNTTQAMEKLQEDLNSCNTDLVIMLFGMANSWNYYGYTKADTYWERIRVVKLFRRIRYNLKYKGASSDTESTVFDFALSFLDKAKQYPAFGEGSEWYFYYYGRYFLALRDWDNSANSFALSLSKNQFNTVCLDAMKICLREYDKESFYNYNSGNIKNTIVPQTIQFIDLLIEEYPETEILNFFKEEYVCKKDPENCVKTELKDLYNEAHTHFRFDLIPYIAFSFDNNPDNIISFLDSVENEDNTILVETAKIWFYLVHQNIDEAKHLLNDISLSEDSLTFDLISFEKALCDLNDSVDVSELDFKKSELEDFLLKYFSDSDNAFFDGKNYNERLEISLDYILTSYNYSNRIYFLPHNIKRTANIDQSGIFNWIKSDIERSVEMCLKQNCPVICMNYPLIPPPNSQEISFWADSVGKIWYSTANKYQLNFVNNDSAFKSKGEMQNDYFEPHDIGSEHCSDKGYGLIAENIALVIIENYLIEK
ncbi:MAG: hypothetical protein C0596_12885 [Marinilabiliales bacterium]|nr:MAG: hypothetical protein C0596_12885 [Marinilabiliales bacterium]